MTITLTLTEEDVEKLARVTTLVKEFLPSPEDSPDVEAKVSTEDVALAALRAGLNVGLEDKGDEYIIPELP